MSTDVLPSPEPEAPSSAARSPLRLALSAVVVLLVLALVAGVTLAVRGLSGGGAQPEDALPRGAFAFAKVDLDPSAGQKINALRFLRKFPALRDKVSLDGDLRETLFESVSETAGWEELDFDKDVEPWLGSRVAIAAYPPTEGAENSGGRASSGAGFAAARAVAAPAPALPPSAAPVQPEEFETFDPEAFQEEFGETFDPEKFSEEFGETFNPEDFDEEFAPEGDPGADLGGGLNSFGPLPSIVVALQVTDAAKARAGLDKLIASSPDAPKPGIVIQGDYALLAADQDAADNAAREAKRGVLSADENFSADLAALGDGVAMAWMNTDAMGSLAGVAGLGLFGVGGSSPEAKGAGGRTSYVLRFDGDDALEVRGASTGDSTLKAPDKALQGFDELPEDSVVAFGLAGGNKLVAGFFDSLRATIDDTGPGGPEGGFDGMVADAERELGIDLPDDLAVLLGSNLVGAMRDDQAGRTQLEVGARVTTDGPRAVALVDKINKATKASGSDFPLERRLTDDGVVVASSKGQVDLLLKDGGLGDRDAVNKALPDLDGATVALWVDIRNLLDGFMGRDGVDENVEPIAGLGVTGKVAEDGSATYRLRLVTD